MAASSQLVTLCTKTGWMMAPTRPMEKSAMKSRLRRLVSRSATKIQSPRAEQHEHEGKDGEGGGDRVHRGLSVLGRVVARIGAAARDTSEIDDELNAE